jgi:hypothetical protein
MLRDADSAPPFNELFLQVYAIDICIHPWITTLSDLAFETEI